MKPSFIWNFNFMSRIWLSAILKGTRRSIFSMFIWSFVCPSVVSSVFPWQLLNDEIRWLWREYKGLSKTTTKKKMQTTLVTLITTTKYTKTWHVFSFKYWDIYGIYAQIKETNIGKRKSYTSYTWTNSPWRHLENFLTLHNLNISSPLVPNKV